MYIPSILAVSAMFSTSKILPEIKHAMPIGEYQMISLTKRMMISLRTKKKLVITCPSGPIAPRMVPKPILNVIKPVSNETSLFLLLAGCVIVLTYRGRSCHLSGSKIALEWSARIHLPTRCRLCWALFCRWSRRCGNMLGQGCRETRF